MLEVNEKAVAEAKSLVERAIRSGPAHMILVFQYHDGTLFLDRTSGGEFPMEQAAEAVKLLRQNLAEMVGGVKPTPIPKTPINWTCIANALLVIAEEKK